jgi:hypothetical protein
MIFVAIDLLHVTDQVIQSLLSPPVQIELEHAVAKDAGGCTVVVGECPRRMHPETVALT